MGLTHQTVDQYLHRARTILGAQNRREAARIFAATERTTPFKGFELKLSDVEITPDSSIFDGPTEPPLAQPKLLGLPPIGGPPNDLKTPQRLTAIGKIALFLVIIVLAMVLVLKTAFVALSAR